jgi:solute carrier family 25 protein 38
MVFYERTKTLLIFRDPSNHAGAVGGGTAGAIASLFSTLLTTPFDLLKTRRQLSPSLYPTLGESIKRVYTSGGVRGFWEGASLRIGRKAGSAAVGWAVYESVLGGWERKVAERLREREKRGD